MSTKYQENILQKDVASAGKYLTFVLGQEEYGVEILSVREIICLTNITFVPNVLEYVKGVINLRGKIVPIIDLRMKFNMERKIYNHETCIVVLNVFDSLMGIIVDQVSEVVDILQENIEEAPALKEGKQEDYISGMAKVGDKIKILLDIKKVMLGS